MNFRPFLMGASVVAMGFLSSCGDKAGSAGATTVSDTLSYAYGMLMGKDLSESFTKSEKENVMINKQEFLDAMEVAMVGDSTKLLLTSDQAQKFMEAFGKKRQAEQMKKAEAEAKNEQVKVEQWFAQNVDNKPGIQKTESGLRYEIITAGKGAKPTISDKVSVHYHGTLTDGAVFDSSVERGEPVSFPVGGVIPGWTEALQLMPVGSKWKLYIPSDLGYGPRGAAGGKIPPFATLIFEVELLKIEK